MNIETKKTQRKHLLRLRKAVADSEYKSKVIEDKLFDIIEHYSYNAVLLYASFGSEVNTWGLIDRILDSDISLALPRVNGESMIFYEVNNLSYLIKNKMGILEPDLNICKVFNADDSLLLVPLLGFDANGNRIGYGGGYYDRYLKNHRNRHSKIVGIAFEEQKCDRLAYADYDEMLDYVVTDKRVYKF